MYRKVAGTHHAASIQPRLLLMCLLLVYVRELKATMSIPTERIGGQHHRMHLKGLRLRVPTPTDNIHSEYPRTIDGGKSVSAIDIGPLIGNQETIIKEALKGQKRSKRSAGGPSLAAKRVIDSQLMRSYFATSPEEVDFKQSEEDREKKEAKRSDFLNAAGTLPWSCKTRHYWIDIGSDHYPRFVRSADCMQQLCFDNNFGCKPKSYRTKILKRVTGSEATLTESDDVSLPSSLSNSWKFATISFNLWCECARRISSEGGIQSPMSTVAISNSEFQI